MVAEEIAGSGAEKKVLVPRAKNDTTQKIMSKYVKNTTRALGNDYERRSFPLAACRIIYPSTDVGGEDSSPPMPGQRI
jgi:hypothetical protein